MFKRILSILLGFLIVLAVCGCSDNEKKPQKKPTGTSSVSSETTESNTEDESDTQSSTDDEAESDTENDAEDSYDKADSDVEDEYEGEFEDNYATDRFIPTVESIEASKYEADIAFESESVSWDGPKGYTIIYPKGNKTLKYAAETLKNYFKETDGVELEIKDDSTAAKSKEILIGNTSRYTKKCEEGSYFAEVKDGKLIFGGGHDSMTEKAVELFTRLERTKGKANVFDKEQEFSSTKPNGYTYVWGDEFEGSQLNTKKWNLATKMAGNAEIALDDSEDAIRLENGYLKMFARRYYNPKIGGAEFACPWSVTTQQEMSYRYGYLEMRAKVPFKRGCWPGFWMSSGSSYGTIGEYKADYTIEVDVFEVFSSIDSLAPNIHKWYHLGDHTMWADETDASREGYTFENAENLVNEYHIYGFEWTPTEMIMYIDGEAYYTYDITRNFDNGASGNLGFEEAQLHIIFNNHLFTQSSTWKIYDGCEIYHADLPAEYFVDWIRLYQKDDNGAVLDTAY